MPTPVVYFFTGFDTNQGWSAIRNRADYASSPSIMQAQTEEGRNQSDGLLRSDRSLNLYNSSGAIQMIEWEVGAQTEIVIGACLRPDSMPSAATKWGDLFQLSHGSGYVPATLTRKLVIHWNDTNKEFRFYQNRSGTNFDHVAWAGTSSVLLASTGSLGDLFGTDSLNPEWKHITFVLRSGGTSEVWVEGALAWSGVIGSFGPFHRAGICWNKFAFFGWLFDNFYMADSNLDVVRVAAEVPRVDFSLIGIAPASAAYGYVDEFWPSTSPDEDTTYIQGSATGAKALFYFARMYPFQEIKAVMLTAWVKTTDASVSFRVVARSPEGNEYYSPDTTAYLGYSSFGLTYQPIRILWEVDPETGLVWDEDRLLSYAFGVETRSYGVLRISQLTLERLAKAGAASFAVYRAR